MSPRLRLAFVDLSYHQKTGSVNFLIDLLRARFDLRLFYDAAWIGGPRASIEEINEGGYDLVAFLQVDPRAYLGHLKCRCVAFFPMFDSYGVSDPARDNDLRDVWFVNFSRKTHDSLACTHRRTIYAQYFPDPALFSPPEMSTSGLFYWSRTASIGWREIKTLVGDSRIALPIHCHRAVDPGRTVDPIPSEDQRSYGMTFSEWFDTKADYHRLVSSKALFLAPRESEGIGFSFLEAMAMGKAVIANDESTMNEYIIDGSTGYLFKIGHPRPLDLSLALQVGRNAREYMREGREAWLAESGKVLDFLEAIPAFRMDGRAGRARAGRLAFRSLRYKIGQRFLMVLRLPKKVWQLLMAKLGRSLREKA